MSKWETWITYVTWVSLRGGPSVNCLNGTQAIWQARAHEGTDEVISDRIKKYEQGLKVQELIV